MAALLLTNTVLKIVINLKYKGYQLQLGKGVTPAYIINSDLQTQQENRFLSLSLLVLLLDIVALATAAVWTKDVIIFGEESAADERHLTPLTDEAFTVPVTLFKRNELRSTKC